MLGSALPKSDHPHYAVDVTAKQLRLSFLPATTPYLHKPIDNYFEMYSKVTQYTPVLPNTLKRWRLIDD